MHITEQRGGIVEPVRGQRNLRLPAGGAVGYTLVDKFVNAVELNLRHDGADVDRFIERHADTQGAHAILDFCD